MERERTFSGEFKLEGNRQVGHRAWRGCGQAAKDLDVHENALAQVGL